MNPFPAWTKVALYGAVAAILVAAYATQAVRISLLQKDLTRAETAESAAAAVAAGWQRTASATQDARNKEGEHARKTLEALNAERDLSAAARRDADALRGDVGELRAAARRFAAARSCPAPAHPADAGSSPAAAGTGDLFADVLGGLAEDGAALAAEADRRGIAGGTCERERDPLTTPAE